MPNVLRDGQTWLRQQARQWYSHTAIYVQANQAVGPIQVVRGSTTSPIEAGDLIIETKSVDWIIDVVDLPNITPRPGDFVIIDDNSLARFFEVASETGDPVWRWHESNRFSYRIHSRLTNDLAMVPPQVLGLFGPHFGGLFGNHFGGNWNTP